MQHLVDQERAAKMTDGLPFSVRAFLREREALLVHFNTPMSGHPKCFPDDLHGAATLAEQPLSFSTIQTGDRGPHQGGNPAHANAGGSVGIVVDVLDEGCVLTVGPGDDGTKAFKNGTYQSGGQKPCAPECAASIDDRKTANEWFIKNYRKVGVFVFEPTMVFIRNKGVQGEHYISTEKISDIFSDDRIFTVRGGKFLEYIRYLKEWTQIAYSDIVTP